MDLQKLSKDLSSIEQKVRQKAFNSAQINLPSLPHSAYKKICYGLFFYYWHSDGLENQEKDAQAICSLLQPLKRSSFALFAKTFFEVMKKLWNRIDYHRTNKFLGLVKDLFKSIYKRIKSENSQLLFDYWNRYLSTQLFTDLKG